MIGWWVVRLWPVACLPGELSQHPTWPHSWHQRRCTQSCLPAATHSTQPGPEGPTSLISPRWAHELSISRDSLPHDQAGRRSVRQQLARPFGYELALGGRDAVTPVHQSALAANRAGVSRDRPDEVHLRLERRVPLAGQQRRVDRAAHRRIEEGHRVAAMHRADRVVEELSRLAVEDRAAL